MLWHLVFKLSKIFGINFLVKSILSIFLQSPCAWIVKWHKYYLLNCNIMGSTERFSPSVIVEAVCSKTAPAVFSICVDYFEITVISVFVSSKNILCELFDYCDIQCFYPIDICDHLIAVLIMFVLVVAASKLATDMILAPNVGPLQ